jgi:Na+-transporting methylmalonyl-CoA/oxaloacetate decarboxylase gamma subunit
VSTDGRIGEQQAAYRKGLVLGLTMAEIGILIIFILLLLIAFDYLQRGELAERFANKAPVEPARLQQLERAETSLQEIGAVLGVDVSEPSDDFTRLVRIVDAAARSPSGQTALSEAHDVIEEMQRAVERVAGAAEKIEAGSGDRVAEQLSSLSSRVENQEGLLTRYENQLARLGQGTGGRPCWVQPNGDIDFLYDVVLRSSGISMRERQYPHRAAERARLPMPDVNPRETLTASEFLRRTEPLYAQAKKESCVFFVVVYDATAPHEKDVFIDLLRTVEGHFYKSFPPNAVAPF